MPKEGNGKPTDVQTDKLLKEKKEIRDWKIQLEKDAQQLNETRAKVEKAKSEVAREKAELIEQRKTISTESQRLNELARKVNSGGTISGHIGTVKEFVKGESWFLWQERLDQFFAANGITEDAKKVAVLITFIGSDGYATLRNLCTPALPATKKFAELSRMMEDHFQPKPSVIAERYRFKECRQKNGEDIKTFIENLRRLSTHCEFGDNLENSLRDQFVWGLQSEAIKKRLLSEKTLEYKNAVELAMSLEVAQKNAAAMSTEHSNNTTSQVNFIGRGSKKSGRADEATEGRNKGRSSASCYCCGKPNHRASECRFRNYRCNVCGKVGHLAVVCKERTQNKNRVGSQRETRNKNSYHSENKRS